MGQRKYRRLSMEEREEISRWVASGVCTRAIARELGREASSISREISRNGARRCYRSIKAESRARRNASKRREGKRKFFLNSALIEVVHAKLRLRWSPEQIAEWLKLEYVEKYMRVSAETIYSYLYVLPRGELRKELLRGLRRGHPYRYKGGHRRQRGVTEVIEDMISIEERPAEVSDRTVPGHWEGDMIVGGQREQSVLGTLVERTTRAVLLVPLKDKRAKGVRKAFAREMNWLPKHMRLSLTYDQGREMAQHKRFTDQTEMKVYFAHPRSPWERGTNENTNGLIRQFFPKGTNFRKVSRKEIKRVQHLLNGRPRKVLGFKTPYEAIQELLR